MPKVEQDWNKTGTREGVRVQPFVPPPGTRKKSVPLFDLSCSTTKNALSPYKIKTFTTEWNNWNKWNNKNKKWVNIREFIYF